MEVCVDIITGHVKYGKISELLETSKISHIILSIEAIIIGMFEQKTFSVTYENNINLLML